jgi:hypothetical protein
MFNPIDCQACRRPYTPGMHHDNLTGLEMPTT